MTANQLPTIEYPEFYKTYIQTLKHENLLEDLEISLHEFIKFVQNIPLDKFDYRYEAEKWTIKDIIQHLIDAERIFAYRALRTSRTDQTPLASFDENIYAKNTNANHRSIQDLLTEMAVVRQATLSLFKSFTQEQQLLSGNVLGGTISVRAIGFIVIGHQKHHQKIFQERYL